MYLETLKAQAEVADLEARLAKNKLKLANKLFDFGFEEDAVENVIDGLDFDALKEELKATERIALRSLFVEIENNLSDLAAYE